MDFFSPSNPPFLAALLTSITKPMSPGITRYIVVSDEEGNATFNSKEVEFIPSRSSEMSVKSLKSPANFFMRC